MDAAKQVDQETRPAQGSGLVWLAVAVLISVTTVVGMLFSAITHNFSDNISAESSSHLEEINYQIKLNIEGEIETDWQVAYAVRNDFTHSVRDNDEANIRELLSKARDIWKVDDIIVYTDDGSGIRIGGERIANDVASSTMYNAERFGEYTSIVQSRIIYTLSVATELRMNGAKITAISVERDLQSFLDGMEFSSFDGSAHIYLTQSGGRIISQMTADGVVQTFNIVSEFEAGELVCLTDPTISQDGIFTADKPLTFLLSRPTGTEYVVVTPIETRHDAMHLVYMVPDVVVNQAMDRFSEGITLLCTGILLVLVSIIFAIFLILYRTRKRQFDRAIISRERTFDLLVANTNTAFALLSTQQKEPIYISANADHIIGAPLGSLQRTEKGFGFISGDGSETEALRKINHNLADWDGSSTFSSGYIARPDGAGFGYYEVQLYPVTGNADEYVAIIQDVTQRFYREDAVRNALDMAERSNAAKSRFLSNMSHDIRTPLNAIVNMTKFAKESKAEPALLDEYLDTIDESSDHLLRLINDVLDMSRIESGQAVIESRPFDIKAELNGLADITRPLCHAKRQSLRTDFDGLHTRNVLGDRVKVAQVLMNLLSNAVKFTPIGGEITFAAAEIPSLRAGITTIRFTVCDNGIGIPAASLKSIFNAFARVDDKRVSKIEGTGLGLSICQSYVNAMGGMITCQSEEGKGSAFTVELFFEETEVRQAERVPHAPIEGVPFLGKRCLVFEDNRVNQIIARKLLTQAGFTVDLVSDGREGVERFMHAPAGCYAIIYMDIQMPGMDGYEAAAAIRKSAHAQAKTIPIIAMTADVFAEDVEKARVAGMNGHLGKPIDTTELIAETDKILNNKNGGQS
ncbi:MAG: ATP-binding protein [Clostridia bacterium]|nr:ATP-binding protein [Clostridia bacterium]